MRLDQYLDTVCLSKTRSAAAKLIKSGRVTIGDAAAKASHAVQVGETLNLSLPDRTLTIEVTAVPTGSVAKRDAPDFYRIVSEERIDRSSW